MRTSLVPLSICLWEVRAYSFGFLEAAPAKEVEEAGEKTSAFEMVLSPEAKQKQIYGCFEMVSPPRKQLN